MPRNYQMTSLCCEKTSLFPHQEVRFRIGVQLQTGRLNRSPLVTGIWEVSRLCNSMTQNLCFPKSAAVFGGVENDTVVLNIDTLWEGGPFADPVRRLTPEFILSDDFLESGL
jgi:hypothetical protein